MYGDCDYDTRSMRQSHPVMGMMKYNACIGLANSTNVFSEPEKINATTTINQIHSKNMYYEKEYGYWGNEVVGNKTIIFSHGNIPDKALNSYVKNSNLHCESIK